MASELEVGKIKVGGDGGGSAPVDANTHLVIDDTDHAYLGIYGSGDVGIHLGDTVIDARIRYRNSTRALGISAGGTADQLTIDSTGAVTATNGITISGGGLYSAGLGFFNAGITVGGGFTTLGSFSEVTIASGGITVTNSTHIVDTEGDAASDNLNNINGGTTGSILILRSADSSRDVTVKDATGNIYLAGDFALNHAQRFITLLKYSGGWYELSRSANA